MKDKGDYSRLTQFKKNNVNPFIEETINHLEKGDKVIFFGQKDRDIIIDSETGEIKGGSLFSRRIKVDKASFQKVYLNNLQSFFDLSLRSVRLLMYVMSIVKPNQDHFTLNIDEACDYTGYKTQKTIRQALGELIENNFIARGWHSFHYYINPTIFFNGDRIAFIDLYEKESKNEFVEDSKKMLIGEFGKKAEDEEKA